MREIKRTAPPIPDRVCTGQKASRGARRFGVERQTQGQSLPQVAVPESRTPARGCCARTGDPCMTDTPGATAEQILGAIDAVAGLYHRLVLLVGAPATGKTTGLRQLAELRGVPLLNVNLGLSQALLEVSRSQRSLAAPRLLKEIVEARPGDTVLLDNIEILFAPDLQLDPLRALQQLSRNRTVVASWNGRAESGRLLYAEPSHSEYRDYPAEGLILIVAARPRVGTGP